MSDTSSTVTDNIKYVVVEVSTPRSRRRDKIKRINQRLKKLANIGGGSSN